MRIILFLLLLSCLGANAQTRTFKVRLVLNTEQGAALNNLNINIKGHLPAATCDGNGVYTLNVPDKMPGDDVFLDISGTGYVIVYPEAGRIPIPRNRLTVTEVIVCKKEEKNEWVKQFYSEKIRLNTISYNNYSYVPGGQKGKVPGLSDWQSTDLRKLIDEQRLEAGKTETDKSFRIANEKYLRGDYAGALSILRKEPPLLRISEIEQGQLQLKKINETEHNKAALFGDLLLIEGHLDSALNCYRKVAASEFATMKDILKAIAMEAAMRNATECYFWIEAAKKKTPRNDDEVLHLLMAEVIRWLLVDSLTEDRVNNLINQVSGLKIQDPELLLSGYTLTATCYLAHGMPFKATEYINKITATGKPHEFTLKKCNALGNLRDYWEQEERLSLRDSITDVIVTQLWQSLSVKKDEIAEWYYLSEAYKQSEYKYFFNGDTTSMKKAFNAAWENFMDNPSPFAEMTLLPILERYGRFLFNNYDLLAVSAFYSKLIKAIESNKISARNDFNKSLYFLNGRLSNTYYHMYESGRYFTGSRAPAASPPASYRLQYKRNCIKAYIAALHYAELVVKKDSTFYNWLGNLIEEPPFGKNKRFALDTACVKKVSAIVRRYKAARGRVDVAGIVLHSYFNSPFIKEEEDDLLMLLLRRLYKAAYEIRKDENFMEEYDEFFATAIDYYRPDNSSQVSEIMHERQNVFQEQLHRVPSIRMSSEQYARSLYLFLSEMINKHKAEQATHCLDSTLSTYYALSQNDNSYLHVVYEVLNQVMPKIWRELVSTDKTAASKCFDLFNKYIRLLRKSYESSKIDEADYDFKYQQFGQWIRDYENKLNSQATLNDQIAVSDSFVNILIDSGKISSLFGLYGDFSERIYDDYEVSIASVLSGQSSLHLANRNFLQAENSAQLSLKYHQDYTKGRISLAHAWLFNGQYSKALQMYDGVRDEVGYGDNGYTKCIDEILGDLYKFQSGPLRCSALDSALKQLRGARLNDSLYFPAISLFNRSRGKCGPGPQENCWKRYITANAGDTIYLQMIVENSSGNIATDIIALLEISEDTASGARFSGKFLSRNQGGVSGFAHVDLLTGSSIHVIKGSIRLQSNKGDGPFTVDGEDSLFDSKGLVIGSSISPGVQVSLTARFVVTN